MAEKITNLSLSGELKKVSKDRGNIYLVKLP